MMFHRLFSIGSVVFAAVLMPVAAQAQFSVGVGRTTPTGDFADEAKTGWAFQSTLGFGVRTLPVRLRADVLYTDFRNVDREPSLYTRVGGEWFRQLGFMLNATREFSLGAVQPYGLVGVGVLREWHDDYSYAGTDHVNLNLNVGVGFQVPLSESGSGLFVEVRPILASKALPLTRPAVNPEVKFNSIPVLIGFRL